MYKFFKKHPDFVLIGLAALFLLIIGAGYFWGITTLVTELNRSIGASELRSEAAAFDIEGARSINLRGLVD